jgi:hypothetical protein
MLAWLDQWREPVVRWLVETLLSLPGGIIASGLVVIATYYLFRSKLREGVASSFGIVGIEQTLQALKDIAEQCEAARTALREAPPTAQAARAVQLVRQLRDAINAVRQIERRSINDAPRDVAAWARAGDPNAQRQLDYFLNEPARVVEGIPRVLPLVNDLEAALEAAGDASGGQHADRVTRIEKVANQAYERLQTAQQTIDATLETFGRRQS